MFLNFSVMYDMRDIFTYPADLCWWRYHSCWPESCCEWCLGRVHCRCPVCHPDL